MHWLYSLCFTFGFLSALPYFLFQILLHRKYFSSIQQRLGSLPEALTSIPPGGIWIHAVSVGEVLAVLPLTESLRRRWPDRPLWVSTTTLTGQELAKSKLVGEAEIFYFPLDWGFAVRRTLKVVRPAVVLIAETEIWPRFLRECRMRSIPVLLVNGRISDRSVFRYRKIRSFMKTVLADFHQCCVQTQVDKQRLLSLGAVSEKVEVCGNLKYDVSVPEAIQAKAETYRKLFGLNGSGFVLIAGSTMRDEEALVLAAFRILRRESSQAILILAPRHPERAKEVEILLAEQSLRYRRRSELTNSLSSAPEVILLDTMGELATLYALADAVFIGGSLVPTGGHNILEPALHRKPILFGPDMSNFREISAHFLNERAAIKVETSTELGVKLVELAQDASLREKLGEGGYAILKANRGATEKTLSRIEPLLSKNASANLRSRCQSPQAGR
jgi:3-deoxy-D-manno-octulosonic-acid transferase